MRNQKVRQRIARAIDGLSLDPRPPGAVKLKDSDFWRVRVGEYRIIYEIGDVHVLVVVLKVADRREAYDNLQRLKSKLPEFLKFLKKREPRP